MATRNSITGDEIKSKALSKEGRRNFDKIFSKKSAKDWEKEEESITILDPDGFRWNDGIDMDTLISYAEFSKRLNYCTILYKNEKNNSI